MFDPQPCENTAPKMPQKLPERASSTASAEHGGIIKLRRLIFGSQRLGCGFAKNTTCASPGIMCLLVQLFAEFRDSVAHSSHHVPKLFSADQDKQHAGINTSSHPPKMLARANECELAMNITIGQFRHVFVQRSWSGRADSAEHGTAAESRPCLHHAG